MTQNRRIYKHGIFYAGIDILSSAPMSRRDLTSWLFVTRDLFIKMNHYTVPSPSKFLNICQKMLLFNRVGVPKSDIRVYISFRFLSFSPHKSAQCMVTKRNFTSIQVHVLYLFNDFRYTFTLNWWVTSLINVSDFYQKWILHLKKIKNKVGPTCQKPGLLKLSAILLIKRMLVLI